jgi:MFS family permease
MSAAMVLLTHHIKRRGTVLIWAVMMYGLSTVAFGFSRSFWLSFACLAMSGASDTVSMIIRNLVRQLETPDHLRGRMLGVQMVFVRGGPELGELESGALANWLGAPIAVIAGGLGCLAATGWVVAATPQLRRYRAEAARTEEALPAEPAP